ncbi:hypothetical protein FB446DRAFT_804530 [Lentinula raphanica]|nr:hypothetical protein FB446DRAFT_804530 [Lentinula raphanica]
MYAHDERRSKVSESLFIATAAIAIAVVVEIVTFTNVTFAAINLSTVAITAFTDTSILAMHDAPDTSNGTWSPSPSLSSLGSAVWSTPSFVSSTASLVTGAVRAVTGSSPGTRSRTASSPSPPRTSASGSPKSQPRQKTPRTHSSAPLSPSVLSRLAKEFAQKVPDEESSVASLQGYLLRNKSRPEDAVKGVDVWVEEERRNREKQKGAKKAKEDEAQRKRKERRKEKAKEKEEQKEKEKTQAEPVLTVPSPTAPAAPTDANVVSEPSTTVLPTDSMILMPSSEPEPAVPSVSSSIIVAGGTIDQRTSSGPTVTGARLSFCRQWSLA